jgi:hypothetical protein
MVGYILTVASGPRMAETRAVNVKLVHPAQQMRPNRTGSHGYQHKQ